MLSKVSLRTQHKGSAFAILVTYHSFSLTPHPTPHTWAKLTKAFFFSRIATSSGWLTGSQEDIGLLDAPPKAGVAPGFAPCNVSE